MNTDDHFVEHICAVCQTSFSRKTHLTRHLRSHMNQRTYVCALCSRASFTRNDLLTRHVKRCALKTGGVPPSRKKSCMSCIQRKIKCDLQQPCAKCAARHTQCTYTVIHEPESVAGPSNFLGNTNDLGCRLGIDTQCLQSGDRPVSSAESHIDQPPESWGTRSAPLVKENLTDTFHSLVSSDPNQGIQPFIIPPSPNASLYPTQNTDLSSVSRVSASPNMGSDSTLDSLLYKNLSFPNPSYVPPETEINGSFFGDFLNQAYTSAFLNKSYSSTFHNLDSLLCTSAFSSTLASPEPMAENVVPNVETYLANFLSFHCRAFPFVHLPTWNESSATPLLIRAMQASGALYVTEKVESRAANKYIIETLQGNLRQEIFRTFVDTPLDDLDTQMGLVLALAFVQNLGLFNRSHAERGTSTAYHGMMVTMVRKSALPAALEGWNLIDVSNSPQAWKSWVRYEAIKRVLLLVYLHDTLMPIFHNLPPCLDENEFPFHLPCNEALWEAPDASSWAALATTDSAALRGLSLHTQLTRFLCPCADVPSVPLNRFACFVTIHALLRAVVLARGRHLPLQRALGQWYICWLAGDSAQSKASEQPNFTSIILPLYWLAELMAQLDGEDPISRQGHLRYTTVKRWLKEFWGLLRATGDIGSGGISGPDHNADAGNGRVQEMTTPEDTNESDAKDDGLLEWIPYQGRIRRMEEEEHGDLFVV